MKFVTRSQSEALALKDRIVQMRDGRIEQFGAAEEIGSWSATGVEADSVGFATILPLLDGGALVWRAGAVRLGEGPFTDWIPGASLAGEQRGFLIDSELGTVKADAPASAPPWEPGSTVSFDLPRSLAVRLERTG